MEFSDNFNNCHTQKQLTIPHHLILIPDEPFLPVVVNNLLYINVG